MQNVMSNFDGVMETIKNGFSAVLRPMEAFFSVFSNFWLGLILVLVVFLFLLANSIRKNGTEFARLIKKPKTLATCAMLIALNIVLGYATLTISSYIRIGFGFVTVPVVSMMFGPLVGCVMGMAQDILAYIIKPTGALLISITMTAGMTGIIYARAFHKKSITFLRVLLTQMVIIIFINIILNSIALAPTVASGLIGIIPSRVIKNIILLPIQSVIIYTILKTTEKRLKK